MCRYVVSIGACSHVLETYIDFCARATQTGLRCPIGQWTFEDCDEAFICDACFEAEEWEIREEPVEYTWSMLYHTLFVDRRNWVWMVAMAYLSILAWWGSMSSRYSGESLYYWEKCLDELC